MSPLERLGLEVVAYQLLGSRTKAATLCALIEARGRVMSYDALAEVKPWRDQEFTNGRNVIKTRICLLRESLEDVGLGGIVSTADGGYTISRADAGRAIHMLSDLAR